MTCICIHVRKLDWYPLFLLIAAEDSPFSSVLFDELLLSASVSSSFSRHSVSALSAIRSSGFCSVARIANRRQTAWPRPIHFSNAQSIFLEIGLSLRDTAGRLMTKEGGRRAGDSDVYPSVLSIICCQSEPERVMHDPATPLLH